MHVVLNECVCSLLLSLLTHSIMATSEPPKVTSVATAGQSLEVKANHGQLAEVKVTPISPSEVKATPDQPPEVKEIPEQPLEVKSSPAKPPEATSRPPKVIVRGISNDDYFNLVEAGKHYLEQHFPDWVERKATSILPQIPSIAFTRALAPPPEGKGPGPNERGEYAELAVYNQLFSWGKKHDQPMFIIAQLNYHPEDTNEVLSAFLDFKGDEIKEKLEIDFVIVHAHIGVILVEVKATENPASGKCSIRGAATSLRKGENLVRLFCDGLFPIYKLAVFPNCSFKSLSGDDMTRIRCHSDIIPCDSTFVEEFKTLTQGKGFSSLPEVDILLPWLISLKCLVSSTVSKVSLADDSVNLAKQVKKIDDRLTRHDVFSQADKRNKLVKDVGSKLTKQVLYLNPEQLAVWNGPKRQIIQGIAGTGKTILIQHKVLELDKDPKLKLPSDEKIIVVTTRAIGKVYRNFFAKNKASKRVEVYCDNFMQGWTISSSHHLFVDESQRVFQFIRYANLPRATNVAREAHCWVFLDPVVLMSQYVWSGTATPRTFATKFEIPRDNMVSLSYVMRCAPDITDFWKNYTPPDCSVGCYHGNRLFTGEVVHHSVDSDENAVKIIQEQLTEIVHVPNVTYNDCAVLIQSSHLDTRRMINIRNNLGSPRNELCMCINEDIWSLEWSYVFLIGQDAEIPPEYRMSWKYEMYLASSRCKVKLFVFSMEEAMSLSHAAEELCEDSTI